VNIISTPSVTRVYSDAGCSSADKAHSDTNSCTVNALANTTGWEWNLCHDIAAESGRRRGKGHDPVKLLKQAGHYGVKSRRLTRIKRSNAWTVQKFIKKNPTGVFYVCSSRHAFSIVDGVVKDWLQNGDLVRIVQAWRILPSVYNGRKVEVPVHKPKPKPWLREKRVEYSVRLIDKDGDCYDVYHYGSRAEALKYAKQWELTEDGEGPCAVEVERVTIGRYDWKTVYTKTLKDGVLHIDCESA
jgi:hypothetical protein